VKSDFKAAYRCCPVSSADLEWTGALIVDPLTLRIHASHHLACPFGAKASVYAWDRVGAAFVRFARLVLLVPILRYVDDLFGPEFLELASSSRACFLELAARLGLTLEPAKTPIPASVMPILGVRVELEVDGSGALWITLAPEDSKRALWVASALAISKADDAHMADLERLIGRLSFACWAIWGPRARAAWRNADKLSATS
jgi:hypothetical protein